MLTTPQRQSIILAANQDRPSDIQGQYLEIVSCTQALIGVGFNGDQPQQMEAGKCYPGPEGGFKHIRWLNYAAVPCTVVYRVCERPVLGLEPKGLTDLLAALQAILIDTGNLANIKLDTANLAGILAELQGPATAGTFGNEQVLVAATPTPILAAEPGRHACVVQAKPTNPAIVYVGFDNTVSNAKYAFALTGAQGYTFQDYRGPLYAYSVLGGDVIVYGSW